MTLGSLNIRLFGYWAPGYRVACYIQRQRRSCFGLTKASDGLVQRAPMRWIEVGLFIEVLQLGFETLVDQEERL
jgi:hypothetical protein